MSVDEAPPLGDTRQVTAPTAEPAVAPAVPASLAAVRRAMARPRQGDRQAQRHLLAVAFAVAWLACPLVEPLPSGSVHYPLWQLPIDVAAVVTIVAVVVALWRGSRHAARLGMAAGVLMAVETIVCPLAGHTPFGWWTWAQTGLSLFVLLASAALATRQPRA